MPRRRPRKAALLVRKGLSPNAKLWLALISFNLIKKSSAAFLKKRRLFKTPKKAHLVKNPSQASAFYSTSSKEKKRRAGSGRRSAVKKHLIGGFLLLLFTALLLYRRRSSKQSKILSEVLLYSTYSLRRRSEMAVRSVSEESLRFPAYSSVHQNLILQPSRAQKKGKRAT